MRTALHGVCPNVYLTVGLSIILYQILMRQNSNSVESIVNYMTSLTSISWRVSSLFPYNDSCHVNYSAHKVSVPKVNFPVLVATSIVAVSRFTPVSRDAYTIPSYAGIYTLQLR